MRLEYSEFVPLLLTVLPSRKASSILVPWDKRQVMDRKCVTLLVWCPMNKGVLPALNSRPGM